MTSVVAGALITGPSTADTILASADSRAEFDATPVIAETTNTFRLAVGPVDGVNRSFRSYLAFDLTSETTASAVTVDIFDAGVSTEANTAANFTQNLTLFQVASDWDGGTPGGTDLASIEVTFPSTGNATANLSFSSAALTAAFNSAVGNTLYLGLYSPEGEAAAAGTRSFVWLSSLESSVDGGGTDPGARPSLTYTPVPEPGSLALLGLGGLLIARRRR